MSQFFFKKHVLVTGGSGFIGSNLVDFLMKLGAKVHVATRGKRRSYWSNEPEIIYGDLSDKEFCLRALKDIDYVFHLAAEGFTSIANPSESAKNFILNILINSNIFYACQETKVSHLLFASSLNVYDSGLDILSDEEPWTNHPHPAQKYFAWTKRIGELQVQSLHELGKTKTSIVRIGGAYGTRDNFDPQTARVIPALINKAYNLNEKFVVWGTGEAQRSFVFVDDIVEAMCLCMEKNSKADPINIGSKEPTSIKDLVSLILKIVNSPHTPYFDKTKPEGIPKIVITTSKAKSILEWEAKTPLEMGLKKTISWYEKNFKKNT